jgi:hypothetical protein
VRIFVLDHSVSPSKSHYSIGTPFTAVPTDVKQPEVTQRVIEAQADILKVCPDYVVASNNQDKADYILVLGGNESERDAKVGFGGLPDVEFWDGTRVRGVSIFRMNGDMVFASRQNRIQRAIREICTRINPTK